MVRRIATVILCLALLAVTPGCAPKQIADSDFQLGPLRTNMTLDEVKTILGDPIRVDPMCSDAKCYQYAVSEQLRLLVVVDEQGVCTIKLEPSVNGHLIDSGLEAASGELAKLAVKDLATPRSISIGDDMSRVVRQYGKPDIERGEERCDFLYLRGVYVLGFTGTNGIIDLICVNRSNVAWGE